MKRRPRRPTNSGTPPTFGTPAAFGTPAKNGTPAVFGTPADFRFSAVLPAFHSHPTPPTPEEAWRRYAPPRSLGATEEQQLAMDERLRASGLPSLLSHAVGLGLGFAEIAPQFLGYAYLAGLAQNGLLRAGVTTVADDMTRRWIELKHSGAAQPAPGGKAHDGADGDAADGADKTDAPPMPDPAAIGAKLKILEAALRGFGLRELFNEAAQKCDFDGGCLIFIDTGEEDDEALARELIPDGALLRGRVRRFTPVEAVNLCPGPYNAVNPLAPDYFAPDSWMVLGRKIHASRFLYFAPNQVPMLLRPAYNFFGIPAAQIALDYLAHFSGTREAAQRLLTKFSLTVFKSNMAGIFAGGSAEHMDRRLHYLARKRDNDAILLIDKEQEDVIKLETPLSGVTEIVRQSLEFLAAIFRIPFVKFLGISPGGLNATGEADLRNYFDHVAGKQEKILRPPLQRVLGILQLHLFGEIDPGITAEFVPLCGEDDARKAATMKAEAERDAIYIDRGVLTPAEVRRNLGLG